jgi:hypothetical protein
MTMEELEDLFNEESVIEDQLQSVNNDNSIINDDVIDLFDKEDEVKTTDSVLDELLKQKGIIDSKVIILDEDNQEKETNFYELSKEEQLEILNLKEESENNDLNDKEIELINTLRTNNIDINEYLESYKQQVIDEYINNAAYNYEINNYSDQELFLLDLKNKYDLTDEELSTELATALTNEDLFKKKIDKLRLEYKELEDNYNSNLKLEQESKKNEEYSLFTDKIVDIAIKTSDFYGIELEDDEKNEVLSFLLDLDEEGTSDFYKTLNDPKKLYEAAWFLRYGKESFDALKNAYESEIQRLKKDKPIKVVTTNKTTNKEKSIHDLF